MDKLTSGYEKFVKNKKPNKNSLALFEKALKKASKPRGSK